MKTSEVQTTVSTLGKWVPLICATAAVGVSIIALKEIKNARREIRNVQKEVNSVATGKPSAVDEKLLQKIEKMDQQLLKVTQYLSKKKASPKPTPPVQPPILINKVINEDEELVEVEEIVTDDEEN
jgi:methylthioribose-1-phosphate isomerase